MQISNHAVATLFALFFCAPLIAEEHAPTGSNVVEDLTALIGTTYSAMDSLDTGEEPSAEAQECLDGLCWQAAKFQVTCEKPSRSDHGDFLIRFPSPVSSGDAINDLVAMEWYVAKDENGRPRTARAVVVIHESGSGMTFGRVFARGLRQKGLHTFMLQLPFYGDRRAGGKRPENANHVMLMRQGIADVRRARDAVAVLPWVDQSHIALQGTSLGGFVSATTAGLDRGYDSVFLMLAGGELYDLLQNGKKDAAKVREALEKLGISGEKLQSLAWTVEPTRVAHRLDPERTWLFSGVYDTVVPPKNSLALAKSAGLDPSHHIRMLANHYTGVVYLPFVLNHIHEHVTTLDVHSETNAQSKTNDSSETSVQPIE